MLILFTLGNSGKGLVLLLYIVYLVEPWVGAGAPPVYLVEPWVVAGAPPVYLVEPWVVAVLILCTLKNSGQGEVLLFALPLELPGGAQ